MQRIIIKVLSMVVTMMVVVAVVAVGALAGTARVRTGKWVVPSRNDVRVLVKEIAEHRAPAPSKTIYLQRGELEIVGGPDNAVQGRSSLVQRGETHTVPRYKVSNAAWQRLVQCVESKFAGYDVNITDTRPTSGEFILVKVGGDPGDIGMDGKRLGGIAPFNGYAVPNSVVFAFDQGGRYRTRNNCQTVAHEIGHVYGLDHTFQCKDMMSYKQCGPKSFVDKPMKCGEHDPRLCEGDTQAQNSAQRLLALLGPRKD